MASETEVTRGLEVICPRCKEPRGVAVFLDNVDSFYCSECEENFDRDEVEALLASAENWRRVLKWLDTAPQGGE